MASARQIAANQRNAQNCTGPKTEEGKQRSARNSLRHGLTASAVCLPFEEETEYWELRAKIIEQFLPESPMEWMLVDQLASAWWRTVRVRKVEGSMLTAHTRTMVKKHDLAPLRTEEANIAALGVVFASHDESTFKNYQRYEASIERAFYRAYDRLQKLVAQRERQSAKTAPEPPQVIVEAEETPVATECSKMGLVSFGSTAEAPEPAAAAAAAPAKQPPHNAAPTLIVLPHTMAS